MLPPLRVEFTNDEISDILKATQAVLRSGKLILGPYTEQFEAEMAILTNNRRGVACSSGTSALEIIFRALNVARRPVLLPTNTNFATAAAAIYAGADVTLYDGGLYPDIQDIGNKLTSDTAAVVAVHIGGYVDRRLPELVRLCEETAVPLVEDAAHAHGATLAGRPAGSFGYAAAFSFYPTKVVTTGEGGMVVTDDDGLADRAMQYRDQGKSIDGAKHELWGNSWRITEIAAAIGTVRLRKLRRDTALRLDILRHYENLLAGIERIQAAYLVDGMVPSGYKSIAILEHEVDRALFRERLAGQGIQLGAGVYDVPLHRQPVFRNFGDSGPYPKAEAFCDQHVCLPIWRHLDAADVERVASLIAEELPGL